MANLVFPEAVVRPIPEPQSIVRVTPDAPLAAIRDVLGISIHDVVNYARRKAQVAELYRITRRIDNEAWLRRRFEEERVRRWIADHL